MIFHKKNEASTSFSLFNKKQLDYTILIINCINLH